MTRDTNEGTFVWRVRASVRAAGLPPFIPGDAREEPDSGDAVVDGRIGAVLVRFRRDRGQEEIEFRSSSHVSAEAFPLCDVEVALGWLLPGDVWKVDHVENLANVLAKLSVRWPEVDNALTGPSSAATWAAVAAARDQRVAAFEARLVALAKAHTGKP